MKQHVIFLLEKIKKYKFILLFFVIFLVGIFLRTYNFHDWLHFEHDQLRDADLVGNVLEGKNNWPLLGPTMRKSGISDDELFHIGPIYYHFQILSAKFFGNKPDAMAYPDLFFSILSIPLLYIFLKRCFNENITLILTSLYAISCFSIRYSRFAWNSNLIPFFVLLFLLSFSELLLKKEKTHWKWIVFSGISMGVGIQLHAVLLILFSITAFLIFIYLLKNNPDAWKKLTVIFLIIVVLNLGYLISEYRNNFSNSKIIFKSERLYEESFLRKFIKDIDCHMEANFYTLSSYGSGKCNFSYSKLLKDKKAKTLLKKIKTPGFIISLTLASLFSIFGYSFLVHGVFKRKDEKKKFFLGLMILYAALFFLIMLFVIDESFDSLRYFSPVFFVPFMFLGFLIDFMARKLPKKYLAVSAIIVSIIAVTNINSIKYEFQKLRAGKESDIYYLTGILGELESMAKYLISSSGNQKNIYISGDRMSLVAPIAYLAKRQNFNIIEFDYKNNKIPPGKALFYISDMLKNNDGSFANYKIKQHKVFGKVIIYKLEN